MTTIEQLLEERADQSHQITLLRDHVRSLQSENAALRKAMLETLEANAHLADGDNCTLKQLKDAIGQP